MKNKMEIIEYVNSLVGYEGYVQFSHRPFDIEKDIFHSNKTVHVDDKDGFIVEAHFSNGSESIQIKNVNAAWMVDTTDISDVTETQTYQSITDLKIKMAQIWEAQNDKLCAGMKVEKLTKVVFAGFVKGEEQ